MRGSRVRVGRWILIAMSLALGAGLSPVGAQTENRAGLVIQHGDGQVETYCVRFSESSISGLELLTRSGQSYLVESGGLGAAVCRIGGEGCAYPSQTCFCQCQGASCAYWNYFNLIDGGWRYAIQGAAGRSIVDGAIDGWAWGDQLAPPLYTIDQICSEASSAPTVAPTATAAVPEASALTPTATEPPEPSSTTAAATDTPAPNSVTAPANPTPRPSETVAATEPPEPSPAAVAAQAAQADPGSYAVFALVVVVLGGWLIVAQLRKKGH